jgi:hypothetical protein
MRKAVKSQLEVNTLAAVSLQWSVNNGHIENNTEWVKTTLIGLLENANKAPLFYTCKANLNQPS